MQQYRYPTAADLPRLLERPVFQVADIQARVRPILEAVRAEGDAALLRFSRAFDGLEPALLRIPEAELATAGGLLSPELRAAIDIATANLRAFHGAQAEPELRVETQPGVVCYRRSVPIQRVGLYIPGGTAPLFSTVLMLAVPAVLAGCSRIVLCTPPDKTTGEVHPAIRYAAAVAGVVDVFAVGGAQAVAALAYGTESIPQVDKIFGPGNQYVTCAKQILAAESGVAIDLPAGPSEVLVVADDTSPLPFVVADLLAQAEHGADSQVVLLTTSEAVLQGLDAELERQLALLPRADIARQALAHSRAILLKNNTEVVDVINQYAPEHLVLCVANPQPLADAVMNAGSVFLGLYTPESAGDYASGTNHTLPTNGYARAYSGVSLDSFVKKITFQQLSPQGLRNLGPHVEHMARAEELDAHAQAVTIRLAHLGR